MTTYYAKSTGGFYNTSINGNDIPADAIEITDGCHASLLDAQSQGKKIITDDNGFPVAIDPPPPAAKSEEDLALYILSKRDGLLESASIRTSPLQDAVDLGIATDDEKSELLKWKKYRIDLNRVENQDGFPLNIQWPIEPLKLFRKKNEN